MRKICSFCRAPLSQSGGYYEVKYHNAERQHIVLTLCPSCGREVESVAEKQDCYRCRAASCRGCPVAEERRKALASAG